LQAGGVLAVPDSFINEVGKHGREGCGERHAVNQIHTWTACNGFDMRNLCPPGQINRGASFTPLFDSRRRPAVSRCERRETREASSLSRYLARSRYTPFAGSTRIRSPCLIKGGT